MNTFSTSQYLRCFVFFCLLCALPLNAPAASVALPASGALSGAAAHTLMADLKPALLVLDVRTVQEFAENHVPGAVNIPVEELERRIGELPADRPILIICRTGRRAEAAYAMLRKAKPELIRQGLWYLRGTPEYKPDGSVLFR